MAVVYGYKFTHANMQTRGGHPALLTRGGYQWRIGEPRETYFHHRDRTERAPFLSTDEVFHFYRDASLAFLMDLSHGKYTTPDAPPPRFWYVRGEGHLTENHTLSGATRLTLLQELPVSEVTLQQRVEFIRHLLVFSLAEMGYRHTLQSEDDIIKAMNAQSPHRLYENLSKYRAIKETFEDPARSVALSPYDLSRCAADCVLTCNSPADVQKAAQSALPYPHRLPAPQESIP